MTDHELAQLAKANPTKNRTELALMIGRYATPEYYQVIHAMNRLKLGYSSKGL